MGYRFLEPQSTKARLGYTAAMSVLVPLLSACTHSAIAYIQDILYKMELYHMSDPYLWIQFAGEALISFVVLLCFIKLPGLQRLAALGLCAGWFYLACSADVAIPK